MITITKGTNSFYWKSDDTNTAQLTTLYNLGGSKQVIQLGSDSSLYIVETNNTKETDEYYKLSYAAKKALIDKQQAYNTLINSQEYKTLYDGGTLNNSQTDSYDAIKSDYEIKYQVYLTANNSLLNYIDKSNSIKSNSPLGSNFNYSNKIFETDIDTYNSSIKNDSNAISIVQDFGDYAEDVYLSLPELREGYSWAIESTVVLDEGVEIGEE